MNKELIKKYKKEFDHWVNEGKLLCYTELYGPYYEVNDEKWDFVCDIGFIINDEYVEFRKALAEGKTIQVYDVIEQHKTKPGLDIYDWRDFKSFTQSSSFTYSPDRYRIKPEFKVDDLVYNNETKMILYIEDTFSIIEEIPLDDEFDDSILKEYSIYFDIKQKHNRVEVTLHPQKVTLDVVSMNTLFDRCINQFEYVMEYGWYGGVGCPFSIIIKKAK